MIVNEVISNSSNKIFRQVFQDDRIYIKQIR